MRIESGQPRVVIPSASGTRAPARSFREHLQQPERLQVGHARALLGNAWTAIVGHAPDSKTSAILTAHWALETDAGRAMPGHNFAGIKALPSAPGAAFRTVEGHGATRREVSARFRVYDSAEAGAHDYVKLLQSRYPAALEAARSGDTAGFTRALADGGYFTADPVVYASGLQQRLAEIEHAPGPTNLAAPISGAARGSLAETALSGLLRAFRDSSDDT